MVHWEHVNAMRCRFCHARWRLRCELGPGGEASPGEYTCVALAMFVVAFAVGRFYWWLGAAIFGAVGALTLLMAFCG
jgi:hypothetical protein